MTIPYTFAGATTAIPLANLDANFASPITLGNVAMTLSNTYTSIGNLTLTNVTVSSGSVAVTDLTYTGTLTGGTGIVNLGSGQCYKDASGKVLIGTTTAVGSSVLQVNGALSVLNGNIQYFWNSGNTTAPYIANPSNSLSFYTNSGNEAARIDSGGNLNIGKTAANTTSVGLTFQPAGNGANIPFCASTGASNSNSVITWAAFSSTDAAYKFYVGYGGTVYAVSTTISGISDQRLKENVVDLDTGLDAVMALKPRKFDWKEGKGKNIKGDRGFIAQEFEQVFPDLIDEWKDPAPEGEEPYKAVRADLIPILVKAIQELNAKVDAQAVEITALKGAK